MKVEEREKSKKMEEEIEIKLDEEGVRGIVENWKTERRSRQEGSG